MLLHGWRTSYSSVVRCRKKTKTSWRDCMRLNCQAYVSDLIGFHYNGTSAAQSPLTDVTASLRLFIRQYDRSISFTRLVLSGLYFALVGVVVSVSTSRSRDGLETHHNREFEFYEFFSFLKFNEFYDFFRLKKIRKKFVILQIIDV